MSNIKKSIEKKTNDVVQRTPSTIFKTNCFCRLRNQENDRKIVLIIDNKKHLDLEFDTKEALLRFEKIISVWSNRADIKSVDVLGKSGELKISFGGGGPLFISDSEKMIRNSNGDLSELFLGWRENGKEEEEFCFFYSYINNAYYLQSLHSENSLSLKLTEVKTANFWQ